MLIETESNLNPTINLVIQSDSVLNSLGITDTTLNPLGITIDTTLNPFGITIDTTLNPFGITRDTVVNPLGITRDAVVNPLGISGYPVVDTKMNPVDSTLTPKDIASVKTIGVPDDRFNRPSKGSRNNQIGSVRLDDKEFEKFSEIAQDLGLSNYNLLHRVIRSFIENPYNNQGFNSDTIRKEEKARCTEKMKGLIPITTHEKQLRDETEILLNEMAETNTALKEAIEKLVKIQNSDAYLFLLSNRKAVHEIMKFMGVLNAANPAIAPSEFINSYRNIQQRLKSAESNFEAELTDKLNKQSEEFTRKFVKIVHQLCDEHVCNPFLSRQNLYHYAMQKLGLK